MVLTGRNLVHIAREPLQLSDVTIQPVLFTLLFVYVFGAGIALPGGGSYKDFAIAGLLALNLTTSAMGTAVGLATTSTAASSTASAPCPMWRAAVLVGRSLADLSTAALCTLIVALTGLAIGWRPARQRPATSRRLRRVPALQLRPVLGLRAASASSARAPSRRRASGLVILFPLAFVSNAPRAHRSACPPCCGPSPTGTRSARSRPPPATCSATRTRRRPSTPGRCSTRSRPRCCGRVALLAIFAPLATLLYRRRTTG